MCLTGTLCMTLGMNCVSFISQNMTMFFGLMNQLTRSMFGVVSGTGIVSGAGYPGFY